jgi:hypothetical protein
MAMSVGIAQAACYGPEQQLPQATVDQFLGSTPADFLSRFPDGGPLMISLVRDLAASNPAALPAIIALLASANANQATAIGTGLGQAAQVCVRTDQPYATQVQQALTATNNQDAILAMTAVLGDRPIGALGGGGGGSPGASGGQTNPQSTVSIGSNSTQFFPSNSTLTSSQNYFSSSVGTTPGSATITKTVTTPSRSVSPGR